MNISAIHTPSCTNFKGINIGRLYCKSTNNYNVTFKGFSELSFSGPRNSNLLDCKYKAIAEAKRKLEKNWITKDQYKKYKKDVEDYYKEAMKTPESDFSSTYFQRNAPKCPSFSGDCSNEDIIDIKSIEDNISEEDSGSLIYAIFDFFDDLL